MKLINTIIIIFTLVSCSKTTQVEGTVYSKHNIPVPDAKIVLLIYTTASSYATTTKNQTSTDNSGHYSFEFKANTINKRYRYKIDCNSDSGHANETYIDKATSNHIDFNLK